MGHLMQKMNKEMMKTHQLQTQIAKMNAKNKRLEGTNKILTNELVKMKRKYHNEQNQRIELMTQSQSDVHFEHMTMPWNQFRFNYNNECNTHNHNESVIERIGIPIKTQMFKKIVCCNANVFEFDANADCVYYSHSQYHSLNGINILSLINGSNYGNIQKVHSRKINDIAFRHRTQSELLSVSDDKTMAISDIRSNQRKY